MQAVWEGDGNRETQGTGTGSRPPQVYPEIWKPEPQMIRLKEEDWVQGPQGLISMGEALRMAGYEVG
eukprot:1881037-Karenia_brevis.AAC.1